MPATAVSESLFRLGLNEVLPISEEATTSRVVVNNDVLRTVIFTFDAGQMLTEHASTKAVVVTLLEGEMDFSIGERNERMKAGRCHLPGPERPARPDRGDPLPHGTRHGRRQQRGLSPCAPSSPRDRSELVHVAPGDMPDGPLSHPERRSARCSVPHP